MSGLDDRHKGMHAKLERDSELRFKVNNRRNKLLGLWAAEQLGITGDDAAEYAKTVVMSDFEAPGDDDVLAKLLADFESRDRKMEAATLREKMDELMGIAKDQVFAETH